MKHLLSKTFSIKKTFLFVFPLKLKVIFWMLVHRANSSGILFIFKVIQEEKEKRKRKKKWILKLTLTFDWKE